MLFPAMRPVFRRELDVPLADVARAVEEGLAETPNPVVGSVAGTVIELYPTRAERHIFSPRLSVVLYPRNQTLIVGRYGPNPDIWTFFLALYALCFFAAFGGAIGGFSQWVARAPQTAWVGVPIGVVVALLVYAGALVGRNAARAQVLLLATFFERCVDRAQNAAPSGDDAPLSADAPEPSVDPPATS
jgi:hypothetical protein